MPVIMVENKTAYPTVGLLTLFYECKKDDLIWIEDKPFVITKKENRIKLQSWDAWNLRLYAEERGMEIWEEMK